MPTAMIDVKELPARFSDLLSQAAAGTEIIVTDGDVLRARLVPLLPSQGRIAGLHPGAMRMADDFDAPLPEEFWTGTP